MGKVFIFFGIIFLILGITIVFNSFQGLTGFAVYEDVDIKTGFLVGAWFVLLGLLLAVYRKKEK